MKKYSSECDGCHGLKVVHRLYGDRDVQMCGGTYSFHNMRSGRKIICPCIDCLLKVKCREACSKRREYITDLIKYGVIQSKW